MATSALRLEVTFVLVFLLLIPEASHSEPPDSDRGFSVLVFSKTAGFRHNSIPDGQAAIQELGDANGFSVDLTEDASWFNSTTLSQYQAVIFLNTTGDVLNLIEQSAFVDYIQAGGGYVGIHSAADTEYGWGWYGDLVGAYFQSHPAIQTATVNVIDRVHPAMDSLPARWERTDEWYNYQDNPRDNVHVLATLDESTYSGGEMGSDHPIAWCHHYDGGRAFYTGGGHTEASYSEPEFRQHLLGGILFAAGIEDADCNVNFPENYQKNVLDASAYNPMELDIAPDGRVYYVQRQGSVKLYDPATDEASVIGVLSVYSGFEDGLLGIALDPDFMTNNWVYLFYSPSGSDPKQHVSRFTIVEDQLDMDSEEVMLVIDTQRDQCCHSGGSLEFDAHGNLFISTGDDTNPFESNGFTPIDERSGRSAWDAQKSSSNRNDLRGKVLRITPQDDGSYTIPEGNLFPSDGSNGRPEVYAMGCRNPFRISIDRDTGWLYWGDVGPDAGGEDGNRGPAGHDEFNQAREAGNFGWPYCIADNKAYRDYDFATQQSGDYFDCENPVNDSPNNTGDMALPAANPAMIWYTYGSSSEFPELGSGGRTAMAGPVFKYDAEATSQYGLAEYFHNTFFIYEWSRDWIKEVRLDDDGNVQAIYPFAEMVDLNRPIDMDIGPDGAMYILEWGSDFGGNNNDAQLVRIEYQSASPTGIDEPGTSILPREIVLHNAYPNPFNAQTRISFDLHRAMEVRLEVYDVLGTRVSTLLNEFRAPGHHSVSFDANDLASGVYIYKLYTPAGQHLSGRMVLIK